MNILYHLAGFILIAVLLFVAGQYLYVNYKLEKPTYRVVSKTGTYEIREYKPYLIASAVVPNDANAMNSGFSLVADYIFGNNASKKVSGSEAIAMTTPVLDQQEISEAIAMTVPVVDQQLGEFKKVSFVMPSKYTLENIPTPNNPRVELEEIPQETWAVYTYSGVATQERKLEKYTLFSQLLEKEGVEVADQWKSAAYDPPSTLPPLRTNEIWIQVINF